MKDDAEAKAVCLRYLTQAREALVWKLDGLSDYDVRRPLTPTGTNLLGLVNHLCGVEAGYLGETFGRPFPESFPWYAEDAEVNADMWATENESCADILALYRQVWQHTNATIEALPLDAEGTVPHWPTPPNPVTLQRILVHVVTEVNRHAGQADILRETLDHAVGHRPDNSNLPPEGEVDWPAYVARLQAAADAFG